MLMRLNRKDIPPQDHWNDTKTQTVWLGKRFDCIRQMKLWMIAINIASSKKMR
jgi:hypothetical protein